MSGGYAARCEQFATEVIADCWRADDAANAFPAAVHAAAREAGLLDAGFAPELGGQGVSHRELAAGGLAMARVCAPTTFTMGFNHGALRPVLAAGTEAQRGRFVAEVLARGGYASWCMTEPGVSGTNLLGIETRAVRSADGWVLTGHKCMVGNGTASELYFVLADAWEAGQRLGPTIFAVPRGDGVEVGENTDKLGFRCLPTPDVRLSGAVVDDECVIGGVGGGFPVLLDSLDYMRFGGGVVVLGLAEGALLDVLPWLDERETWGGVRLADESHVQVTLGRLLARLRAAKGLLMRVADALDAGAPCSEDAAALKLLAADVAIDATAAVMQLFGWRGIDGRFAAQKRFRDARQTSIYEGTSEVQAMNLFRVWAAGQR